MDVKLTGAMSGKYVMVQPANVVASEPLPNISESYVFTSLVGAIVFTRISWSR